MAGFRRTGHRDYVYLKFMREIILSQIRGAGACKPVNLSVINPECRVPVGATARLDLDNHHPVAMHGNDIDFNPCTTDIAG